MLERLQCTLAMRRNHDTVIAPRHCATQQLESVLATEIQIQQQAVVDTALKPITGRIQVCNRIEARTRADQFHAQPQQALAHQRFVFNNQDAHVSSILPHQSAPSLP
ncbi:hypothetical protein D3C81_404100 [compost metagenome]